MTPFFLDSRAGPLFAAYWLPDNKSVKRTIVHVPAFAEEMNKSRRMVALQANALAEEGYAVLVLDLFGTGDSAGDFADATWALWLANLADAIAWLKQQGAESIFLWGTRLGVLLAIDFIFQNPGQVERLVAWQPVLNGDTFVTQFLRLRVAAAMMNNTLPQEKTSDLKKQLLQGQMLEVAGYRLNPGLIKPLMALKIDPLALKDLRSVNLFEVVFRHDAQATFGNQQLVDKLRALGVEASLTTVVGDNFWISQEVVTTLALVQATEEMLREWL